MLIRGVITGIQVFLWYEPTPASTASRVIDPTTEGRSILLAAHCNAPMKTFAKSDLELVPSISVDNAIWRG